MSPNELMEPGRGGFGDEDMFDLGAFLQLFTGAVKHNKALILITCALTLFATTVYVVLWPADYQVKAHIMSEQDMDPARDQFYSNWEVFRKFNAKDELQLFTSGPVLGKVIVARKLTYPQVYHSFLDQLSWLWDQSWPGRGYKAVKNWIDPDPYATPETNKLKQAGRTLDGLKSGLDIKSDEDSYVATITADGPTPAIADITNDVINAYLAYRKKLFSKEAETAYHVLDQQVADARREVDSIAAKRDAFAKAHGLYVKFQKDAQDVNQLTNVEMNAAQLRSQIASIQASLRENTAQLKNEPPDVVLSSEQEVNPLRQSAQQHLLDLQSSLIAVRTRYREDSPEVTDIKAQIAKVQELIATEPEYIDQSVTKGVNPNHQNLLQTREQLEASLRGAQASLASTEQTDESMKSRLASLPVVMDQSADLDRDYDASAEKLKELLLRRNEAQVSAAAAFNAPQSVRVIDYARLPTSKHWPKLKYLYPGALLVGLLLGAIVAVLRTMTAGRLQHSDVMSGRIGTRVFATVDIGSSVPALTLGSGRAGQALFLTPGQDDDDRSNDPDV